MRKYIGRLYVDNVLFKLDGAKIVYPGHGDETTIERERGLNLIGC